MQHRVRARSLEFLPWLAILETASPGVGQLAFDLRVQKAPVQFEPFYVSATLRGREAKAIEMYPSGFSFEALVEDQWRQPVRGRNDEVPSIVDRCGPCRPIEIRPGESWDHESEVRDPMILAQAGQYRVRLTVTFLDRSHPGVGPVAELVRSEWVEFTIAPCAGRVRTLIEARANATDSWKDYLLVLHTIDPADVRDLSHGFRPFLLPAAQRIMDAEWSDVLSVRASSVLLLDALARTMANPACPDCRRRSREVRDVIASRDVPAMATGGHEARRRFLLGLHEVAAGNLGRRREVLAALQRDFPTFVANPENVTRLLE